MLTTEANIFPFPNTAPWFAQFGRYEFQISNGVGHYGLPVTLVIGLALVVITKKHCSSPTGRPCVRFFFVGESSPRPRAFPGSR